ncbi:hypothetical protein BZG36_04822 [Bifiguratus adelaidae]|uniref:NAD-dependent epimerase/dehydratase domain-containing protein n=1 Tax=Bifiguratus adelaidae TaxID=1938954 RepID=A0A261XVC6_9FUNG|nr:hypothetical protein BZG36_04822 [Bifiguratus adelaidae]
MRIFVTGATGYIGRVVTEKAVAEGHDVHGLSRTEEGDARLKALGATPVRGDLTTLDVLRRESAQADAVLHLAFIHDFSIDYEEILRTDAAAVDALAEPLLGTGKALVISSGTAGVQPDPAGGETTEEMPLAENRPLSGRARSERHALSLSEKGVRVSSIPLPPYVYGRAGSGFLPLLMQMAVKNGEAAYINEGSLRTSDVYVDDAATLYLLAAKGAKPVKSSTALHRQPSPQRKWPKRSERYLIFQCAQ